MLFFSAAAFAFFLSLVLTWLILRLAARLGIVDRPDGERKIHKEPIPLLGGTAIFLSFFFILFFFRENLVAGELEYGHWLWFFAGACFLVLGGVLDDRFNLKPRQQIVWPVLAIACVLAGNIGIEKITSPLGGLLYFTPIISSLFTVVWLLVMMYTTKLLDGADGLVAGISGIGGLVIFLFTVTTKYHQPDIALAALVFAAACAGFLVWNWHPAKVFLGEGGSLLVGYILGVLAIISGGKIAIALLVLGLPLLDLAWTVIRRLAAGKNPFRFADKKHLHHRLLALGLGQRRTVLIFYAFALVFGLSALFLQSTGKAVAVAILVLVMIGAMAAFELTAKKKA